MALTPISTNHVDRFADPRLAENFDLSQVSFGNRLTYEIGLSYSKTQGIHALVEGLAGHRNIEGLNAQQQSLLGEKLKMIIIGDKLADEYLAKDFKVSFVNPSPGQSLAESLQKSLEEMQNRDAEQYKKFVTTLVSASCVGQSEKDALLQQLQNDPSKALAQIASLAAQSYQTDATFKFRLVAALSGNHELFGNIIKAIEDVQKVFALLETIDLRRSATDRFTASHKPLLDALSFNGDSTANLNQLLIASNQFFKEFILHTDSNQSKTFWGNVSKALIEFAEAHQRKNEAKKKEQEEEARSLESKRSEVKQLMDSVPLAIRDHLQHLAKEYSNLKVVKQFEERSFCDGLTDRNEYGLVISEIRKIQSLVDAALRGEATFEISESGIENLRALLGLTSSTVADRVKHRDTRVGSLEDRMTALYVH